MDDRPDPLTPPDADLRDVLLRREKTVRKYGPKIVSRNQERFSGDGDVRIVFHVRGNCISLETIDYADFGRRNLGSGQRRAIAGKWNRGCIRNGFGLFCNEPRTDQLVERFGTCLRALLNCDGGPRSDDARFLLPLAEMLDI